MPSPKAALESAREKSPALDHLIRAFGRFSADAGNRQAAAVTFFGFLSFFPILALATALLSYFLGEEAVGTVVEQVNSYAPGLAEQLKLEDILTDNAQAAGTGVLGLVGLLYSGLGWVDAMREAIRAVWHHNVKAGNLVVKKLKDVLILAGLGVTILASVAISAATGVASDFLLELIGQERGPVATTVTWLLGLALGLLTSTGLFLFLFWRLPKVQSPFRRVIKGAVLAAVLFEVLKRVGALYIERTTENPLYGAFAVIVGLLVWINLVSRMLLLCAAWVVTAPYDSDIEPSGTANAEAARRAGIPTEFADNDPDDPPTLQEDGAPSPLAAAVQGAVPSQDVPEGRGSTADDVDARRGGRRVEELKGEAGTAAAGGGTATLVRSQAQQQGRAEAAVRNAAQFSAGVLGMAVTAVLIYVLKTVRELVRR
jgi:membrane protein